MVRNGWDSKEIWHYFFSLATVADEQYLTIHKQVLFLIYLEQFDSIGFDIFLTASKFFQ